MICFSLLPNFVVGSKVTFKYPRDKDLTQRLEEMKEKLILSKIMKNNAILNFDNSIFTEQGKNLY